MNDIDWKPIHDGTHCDKNCPHFQPFNHPYFWHSVWCTYLLMDLGYYDGTLADCTRKKPEFTLEKMRGAAHWNARNRGITEQDMAETKTPEPGR